MSKPYQDVTPHAGQSVPEASMLRRLLAKCGFELNYMAAGLFLAGIVILAYLIYETVTPG